MSEIIHAGDLRIKWPIPMDMVGNFAYLNEVEARSPDYLPIPDSLHPSVKQSLAGHGINQLFRHQGLAWENTQKKLNQVIVTGTASGKSLCYHMPVLDTAAKDPFAKALYIFPTKALTQDQLSSLNQLIKR